MKVFPGNHLPRLAIISHRSVVSTRSHCQEQSISTSMISQ